jgi:hypothetical protein
MPRAIAAATLALVLAACGGDPDVPPLASGWIDVPGMFCGDGSPTGIGISRGSADAVLVYLSGGGACWSDIECDVLFRSFGRSEFDLGRFLVGDTILDRSLPGNPFATWTVVFVPYCTGDVHAGDSQQPYAGGWNHHGYRNLQAAVARMAAEVARPAQVVVAGSSAGGFGSLVAYDLVRTAWPADPGVTGALLDDSGPTFVGTTMDGIRDVWWDVWGLGSTVGTLCPACATDLSEIWGALRERHLADRLALVSTTQDLEMRDFFGDPADDFTGPVFQEALAELTAKIEFPDIGAAVFRVGAPYQEHHALLLSSSLASYATSDGTTLLDWLSDMAAERPWTSKGP